MEGSIVWRNYIYSPRNSPYKQYILPAQRRRWCFFKRNSPFSNHFPCTFNHEGMSFSCVEQYLAVQRAYLARDKPLARRAMEQDDPAEHKSILNTLRHDHREEWLEKAPDLILKATRAKYTQNPLLKDLPLSTHSLRIGEASRDSVWGIGLSLDNKDVLDTSRWASEGNLLGRTLMAVREELINFHSGQSS